MKYRQKKELLKTTDLKTGKVKQTEQFLIANFKSDALEFYKMTLQHWRVETYHFVLIFHRIYLIRLKACSFFKLD